MHGANGAGHRLVAGAGEEGRRAIVYATRAPTMSKWLPEVSPRRATRRSSVCAQDRFYNTDLDKTLKAKGITTLILTGWKVSGSVVYTSVEIAA